LFRVLVAGIRFLGEAPCPRCTIPKGAIGNLGTVADKRARLSLARIKTSERSRKLVDKAIDLIYNKGYAVNSKAVEAILQKSSLVPTKAS
jgi:hypothetical protein